MISKTSIIYLCFSAVFLFGNGESAAQDINWTHFRGSGLNGLAVSENIPLKWDDSSIKWKTKIHDSGYSSPVIYNNQVWVTTATSDGRELYVVCIDFNTGELIHDIKVFAPSEIEGKHSLNTYATPTPCIEKGFVYVHYGSLGTACINTENGSVVWKRTDFKCKHVQGPASSPIIYRDLLILHFEGTDVRYIVALNKSTGDLVWKTDRPSEPYEPISMIGRKAYITPVVVNVKGRDMLISPGSGVCIAYEPGTGKEIWRVVGGAESTIAMPFTEKGVVYWYSGYETDENGNKYAQMIALNPDGKGDLTSSANVLWKRREELTQNQMLTPVIRDGLIYTVNTRNNLYCIDAQTGKEIWSERLASNYNASPLFANGIIWLFSVKGEVLAIKAGQKYEAVAKTQMDSGIWATPAFLRNSVILRTQNYLYRIGS
jgi:outer membrane protein assembly factor BamB